jgi:hypothetical protein
MYETFSEAPDAVFSDGHCYGMCLLAKEYYEDGIPDALGDEIDSAADITKPTSKYSRIGEAIDTKHRSQFLDSTTMLEQIPYLAPNQAKNVEPIDVESEIQAIQSAIDQQGTALVGIGQHPVFGSAAHQLIGYNVRFENAESLSEADIAYIDAYDPNRPDNTPQQTLEVYLSEDAERTIADEYQGEMPLYDESGGYESGILYQRFALIGQSRPDFAGQSILTALVLRDILENYIGGYIQIAANSPVRINATAPDGRELLHPEVPVNGVPPSEYVYLTDPPTGEYKIKVEGTGNGSYAINAKGSTIDGGVIEDSINGSITEGEVQTTSVSMPETEGRDDGNDVKVENVSLSPPTVDTSVSQHTLSFVAKNVSTDGKADDFTVELPDRVETLEVTEVNVTRGSADAETDVEHSSIGNTIRFSINFDAPQRIQDMSFDVVMNLTASDVATGE